MIPDVSYPLSAKSFFIFIPSIRWTVSLQSARVPASGKNSYRHTGRIHDKIHLSVEPSFVRLISSLPPLAPAQWFAPIISHSISGLCQRPTSIQPSLKSSAELESAFPKHETDQNNKWFYKLCTNLPCSQMTSNAERIAIRSQSIPNSLWTKHLPKANHKTADSYYAKHGIMKNLI